MRKSFWTSTLLAAVAVAAIIAPSEEALAEDCRPIEQQIKSLETQMANAGVCHIPGVCAQGQRQAAALRARLNDCRQRQQKQRKQPPPSTGSKAAQCRGERCNTKAPRADQRATNKTPSEPSNTRKSPCRTEAELQLAKASLIIAHMHGKAAAQASIWNIPIPPLLAELHRRVFALPVACRQHGERIGPRPPRGKRARRSRVTRAEICLTAESAGIPCSSLSQ